MQSELFVPSAYNNDNKYFIYTALSSGLLMLYPYFYATYQTLEIVGYHLLVNQEDS